MKKKENNKEKEPRWKKEMREYYKKHGYDATHKKFKPDYVQWQFLGKLIHGDSG